MHIDGNDEAYLAFDVDATSDRASRGTPSSCSSPCRWSTCDGRSARAKGFESDVWDRVVESKEASPSLRHVEQVQARAPRRDLRGRPAKIALQWNAMPRGRPRALGEDGIHGIAFPEEYVGPQRRPPPGGARRRCRRPSSRRTRSGETRDRARRGGGGEEATGGDAETKRGSCDDDFSRESDYYRKRGRLKPTASHRRARGAAPRAELAATPPPRSRSAPLQCTYQTTSNGDTDAAGDAPTVMIAWFSLVWRREDSSSVDDRLEGRPRPERIRTSGPSPRPRRLHHPASPGARLDPPCWNMHRSPSRNFPARRPARGDAGVCRSAAARRPKRVPRPRRATKASFPTVASAVRTIASSRCTPARGPRRVRRGARRGTRRGRA